MHHHITTVYLTRPSQEPHLHHESLQRHLSRLAHLLFLLFLFSLTSCDYGVAAQRREGQTYPLLATIPKTEFTCRGHTAGYYADPEAGCQVYHMCDTLQKQYSYLCPNHTLFNQKFMVCDHWYMVNCSYATTFYDLNDHIGEVPNSSERDDNSANGIGNSATRRTTESNKDTSSKEAKTSPVSFTFKAPGSSSLRTKIPTNSLVTETPISEPDTETPQITTLSDESLVSLKPSPTPSHFQSQTSRTSVQPISKPTLRPVTRPSRFFQLPNVESAFQSRSNSLLKPFSPPSVFFQPPHQHSSSNSPLADRKIEVTPNTSSDHGISTAGHDIPFVQTPRPGTPFTMVPGFVARDPGNKFSFTSSRQKKPSLEAMAFKDILFRPLVQRPKDKTRKIFTSAPASVTLNPHHHTGSDQDTEHSTTTVFAAPLTNNNAPSIFLLAPPVIPVSINIPPFLPTLKQTLIPPTRMRQEVLTPLTTPVRFGSTNAHQPFQLSTGIAPSTVRFLFPVSRSHRDFFIPPSGLSLPAEEIPTSPKNSLIDHQNSLLHTVELKKTNMTMVFPTPRDFKITALQINPKCPKCHPAFLRPGECTPCVLIR